MQKLDDLKGNTYLYKGNKITVQNWKRVNALFVISTDSQTFNFYENEIEPFIESLPPYVEVPKARWVAKKPENDIEEQKKEADITQILYDTIANVQKNPDYIGQANAICNVVTQMINIKKLELQISKK